MSLPGEEKKRNSEQVENKNMEHGGHVLKYYEYSPKLTGEKHTRKCNQREDKTGPTIYFHINGKVGNSTIN